MKGASFCQVDMTNPVSRSNPCMTSGIQEWMGASPSFRARAVSIIVVVIGCVSSWMCQSPVSQAFRVAENNMMAAAVA